MNVSKKTALNLSWSLFYLQLINSIHADISMEDKEHSELSSWL